jgi:hypothetical protein
VPRSDDPFFGPEVHSKNVLEIRGLLWRLADTAGEEQDHFERLIRLRLRWDTTTASPPISPAAFLMPVVVTCGRWGRAWPPPCGATAHIFRTLQASCRSLPHTHIIESYIPSIYMCDSHITPLADACSFCNGLILQKAGPSTTTSFQRLGIFKTMLYGVDQGLEGKGWQQVYLDRVIELFLEYKMVWPSQYNDQPGPTSSPQDVWAKATTQKTISLE